MTAHIVSEDGTKTYSFPHCWVHTNGDFTETLFLDGTRVTAVPEDSADYQATALRCGYGLDTAALCREHEIIHSFLSDRLHGSVSPTLWAVAHDQSGDVAPIWQQEQEESLVLAFQTFLNCDYASGVTPILCAAIPLIRLGPLKNEALAMMRD